MDVDTAEPVALDHTCGGELHRGVAAAVAVPAVYPPVTVAGRRYIDGGCLSATWLDLAAGHAKVLFVQMTETPQAEFDAVRELGAELFVVQPDAASLAAFGGELMNAANAFPALETGLGQGDRTATDVATFWKD
jgi:NTE family protein